VEVRAHIAGRVARVYPGHGVEISSEVSLVQGIFGLGGETRGRLVGGTEPGVTLSRDDVTESHRGAVVVTGARIELTALRRAVEVGVAAIVAAGIDDADLRELLGYDLGVAVTGTETIGLTLVITEGFGEIPMSRRTYGLLADRFGEMASVSGATQIRAGVLRPEIIIPWSRRDDGPAGTATRPAGLLEVGTPVRLIRDPWFGAIGTVRELPHEPRWLESGSKARVLVAELQDGTTVVVPRANVELIETEVTS